MQFAELKQQGELAREQGRFDEALGLFDQALVQALSGKNYAEAINILGQRMLVYKLLWQKTGDGNFMELLYADVRAGMRLAERNAVFGQPKSIMYLRAGDYLLFHENFADAAAQYKLALDELNKTSQEAPETQAEYLRHYAVALVKSGDRSGFDKFDESLAMLRAHNNLRPFHRLTIETGTLLRQAEAYAETGQLDKARLILVETKPLVDELATKHDMKTRQEQLLKLAEKFRINL